MSPTWDSCVLESSRSPRRASVSPSLALLVLGVAPPAARAQTGDARSQGGGPLRPWLVTLLSGVSRRRVVAGPSIVFGGERRNRRMTMRYWSGLAAAFLGLASVASAQRFGLTHRMVPVDNDYTRAVAMGDLDGDGDLDTFVGTGVGPGSGQDRLYLNAGTGEFTDVTATNLPAVGDNTKAVALGDVDGDGDIDAFVGNGREWGRDRNCL